MTRSSAIARARDPDDEWRPRLHSGLRMEVIEGEAILLDREQNRVHHLNDVATFILGCCTGDRTEREIVDAVIGHFDVQESVARSDAGDLLARFRALAIIS